MKEEHRLRPQSGCTDLQFWKTWPMVFSSKVAVGSAKNRTYLTKYKEYLILKPVITCLLQSQVSTVGLLMHGLQ